MRSLREWDLLDDDDEAKKSLVSLVCAAESAGFFEQSEVRLREEALYIVKKTDRLTEEQSEGFKLAAERVACYKADKAAAKADEFAAEKAYQLAEDFDKDIARQLDRYRNNPDEALGPEADNLELAVTAMAVGALSDHIWLGGEWRTKLMNQVHSRTQAVEITPEQPEQ